MDRNPPNQPTPPAGHSPAYLAALAGIGLVTDDDPVREAHNAGARNGSITIPLHPHPPLAPYGYLPPSLPQPPGSYMGTSLNASLQNPYISATTNAFHQRPTPPYDYGATPPPPVAAFPNLHVHIADHARYDGPHINHDPLTQRFVLSGTADMPTTVSPQALSARSNPPSAKPTSHVDQPTHPLRRSSHPLPHATSRGSSASLKSEDVDFDPDDDEDRDDGQRKRPSRSRAVAPSASTSSHPDEIDNFDDVQDPALRKRRRNTEAARRSREKKVLRLEQLEAQCKVLETANATAKVTIAVLESDKAQLLSRQAELRARVESLEAQLAEAHKALVMTNAVK